MLTKHGAIFNPGRNKQRGAALLVMLVIVVMGAAAFFVGSLNNSGLQIARDQRTAEALAQAKAALIGKAATYTDYPGSLPCPDTNNDGVSDAGGSTECPRYIGRLPWKTLGLSDLRDSSGERLWYTLSRNVRRYNSVRPLNSETAGTLNITGTYAASNLIAIVFAPEPVTGNQSRSESQMSACTTTGDTREESLCATNYLEGSNANPSPGATPNLNYQSSDTSIAFNDQLVSISQDQLFQQVEKRVGNEIRKILNAFYAAWGAFPFAAPFVDPSLPFTDASKPFIGSANTYSGLLPMGAVWIGIPTYTLAVGSADVSCELRTGYNSLADARARCYTSNISGTPTISITGTLKGLRLWRPHNLSDVNQVRVRLNGNSISASSVNGMNATVNNILNANGSVTVTFTGNLVSGVERIELRDVVVDPSIDPVDPAYTWFTRNKWNQVMYYAVSPGYAPSGGNACTPLPGTPSCLTVNGSSGGYDKQAVVVMTGNALTGQSRSASPATPCTATGTTIAPSACPSNYLELENAALIPTPAGFIYENKTRSSTFNDQVITIAP